MTTDILPAVQLQEVGDSLIELFEITLINTGDTIYLTSGLDALSRNLYFPTADGTSLNEYVAVPLNMGNIEVTSDGPQNRPVLTIANLVSLGIAISNDGDGLGDKTTWPEQLYAAGVTKPEDILGSSVVYRRTLLKNTYRESDVTGWVTTLPKEFPKSKFLLDRVKAESATIVSYELASPYDLEGVKLPNRILVGKYCGWKYQGMSLYGDESSGCSWPHTSTGQGRYYDINNDKINFASSSYKGVYTDATAYSVGNFVSTTGPDSWYRLWICIVAKPAGVAANPITNSVYWERYDVCGKTLDSCKMRFHKENTDRSVPLPFGGFPGSRKFR